MNTAPPFEIKNVSLCDFQEDFIPNKIQQDTKDNKDNGEQM